MLVLIVVSGSPLQLQIRVDSPCAACVAGVQHRCTDWLLIGELEWILSILESRGFFPRGAWAHGRTALPGFLHIRGFD